MSFNSNLFVFVTLIVSRIIGKSAASPYVSVDGNYYSLRNSSQMNPNVTEQAIFSGVGVPPLEMGITFVGVVPLLALISFFVVKIRSRYSKRGHRSENGKAQTGRATKLQDRQMYLQWKSELDAEATKYEMHAEDLRCELSEEEAVKELPTSGAAIELPSDYCHTELLGEGYPAELEVRTFSMDQDKDGSESL